MSEQEHTITKGKALSGASTLFFTQLIGFGVYFLSQRIVLSTLTKEENGSLFLVQFFASTAFGFLVDMGLSNIAIRELIKRPHEREQIIGSVFWIRVVGSVLATLTVIGLAWYRIPDSFTLALCIALYINFSGRNFMLRNTFELRFRQVLQFRKLSLLVLSEFALYFVLLWFNKTHLSPTLIAILLLASSVPGTVYLIFTNRQYSIFLAPLHRTEIKTLLKEVQPIYIMMILQQVHVFLDTWVLQHYAPSLSEVGVFGAGGNMLLIANVFLTSATSILIPLISNSLNSEREHTKRLITQSMNTVQSAVILISVVGSVLTPFIIYIISNNKYADNVIEFRLQFLSSCFITFAQLGVQIATAVRAQKSIVYAGIALVIGSITADFILIPMLFTKGIILSKIWSNFLSILVFLWFVRDWISVQQSVSFILRYVGVIVTVVFGCEFIQQQCTILPALGVAIPFTVIVLFAFRMITKSEVILLQQSVQRILKR